MNFDDPPEQLIDLIKAYAKNGREIHEVKLTKHELALVVLSIGQFSRKKLTKYIPSIENPGSEDLQRLFSEMTQEIKGISKEDVHKNGAKYTGLYLAKFSYDLAKGLLKDFFDDDEEVARFYICAAGATVMEMLRSSKGED